MNHDNSSIRLTHIYPQEMSLYGDWGNVRALEYRLTKMGYQVKVQAVQPGERLPKHSDFYFLGGGQDKEQELIYKDLISKKERLLSDLNRGIPMLAICGGYQLLGKSFVTGNGKVLEGLGYFPVETKSPSSDKKDRCIGNVKLKLSLDGIEGREAIGFENHGGQTTFLNDTAHPLGVVSNGFGNNTKDRHEGCVKNNTLGTYLHGSVLPRNPIIADWLITKIISHKSKQDSSFVVKNSSEINDSIAEANNKHLSSLKFK